MVDNQGLNGVQDIPSDAQKAADGIDDLGTHESNGNWKGF